MSEEPIIEVIAETALAVQPTNLPEQSMPARRAVFVPDPDIVIDIWPTPDDCVRCTPKMVSELLCPGIPINEAIRFLLVCRQTGLNPFGKEIYISKQADDRTGKMTYQFIIGQQAYRRLAHQHPEFVGMNYQEFPEPDDKYVPVIKGVCTVWRKDEPEPYRQVVYYEEVGKGRSGYAKNQPREFLRGIAEARALRHKFPDKFSGTYNEGEFA